MHPKSPSFLPIPFIFKIATLLLMSLLFGAWTYNSIEGRSLDKMEDLEEEFKKLLEACADFEEKPYKVDPYLKTGIYLQYKGKERSLELMKSFAKTRQYENQLIILCRMVFQNKKDSTFRRPLIGGSAFLGQTHYDRWEREPIEIIDGIPFLVTQGYVLGGIPEPSSMYIDYCEKNCDWCSLKYELKSMEEKEVALKKMMRYNRLTDILTKYERDFLKKQL